MELSILVKPVPIVTLAKEKQSLKQEAREIKPLCVVNVPSSVTLSGMVMLVRLWH